MLFNDQFGVYEVTAEAPVKLSVVQSVIEAELLKEKLPPAVQALSARLRQELDFVVHAQALERVRGRIGQGAKAFSAEELEQPIYEHESGVFTIGDLLDFARELGVGFPEDAPEQFDWFVHDIVEPRALLLAGAYVAGVDREEEVVAWFQKRQLSNLLVAMRRDVVDGVFASREEARAFYDRHLDLFRPLESIGVQEVLLRTEEEALALREEVERGGDLGALAAEHTLRRRGKAHQGEFHLHPWEKQQFVPLFEAAQGQKIGTLIGPIAVEVTAAEVLSPEPVRAARITPFSDCLIRRSTPHRGPSSRPSAALGRWYAAKSRSGSLGNSSSNCATNTQRKSRSSARRWRPSCATHEEAKVVRVEGNIPFVEPPQWAVLERSLIDLMNASVHPLMERYVRPDGSVLWPTSR